MEKYEVTIVLGVNGDYELKVEDIEAINYEDAAQQAMIIAKNKGFQTDDLFEIKVKLSV